MYPFSKYGELKEKVFEKAIFVLDDESNAKLIGLELYTAKTIRDYPYIDSYIYSKDYKKRKKVKNYYWYAEDDETLIETISGDGAVLSGSKGNDLLQNTDYNRPIHRGWWGDSYLTGGYGGGADNVKMSGGAGHDIIFNAGKNAIITGDAGNDSITNYGDYAIINGGLNSDDIFNNGYNVTINGDSGNDGLSNMGENVSVYGGEGNDYIDNSPGYTQGLDGRFRYSAKNATLNGGKGDDTIWNAGSDNITVIGGSGNDFIKNESSRWSEFTDSNVSINSGSGDDSIYNGDPLYDKKYFGYTDRRSGSYVTISAGNGNDFVTNMRHKYQKYGTDSYIYSGDNVSINGGTGNNTINNGLYEGHTDTVLITLPYDNGRNYYKVNKFVESYVTGGGNDVTITTDKGNDSILNLSGSGVLISTSGGNNTIQNGIFEGHVETVNVTVDSVTLDTKIFVTDKDYQGGKDVTITAGSGNDKIQSFASSKVTIDAGSGNNQISLIGGGNNISVKGGKGSDSIFTHTPEDIGVIDSDGKVPNDDSYTGSNLTVEAGGGKNVVSISSAWRDVTVEGGDDSKGVDVILSDGRGNILLKGNKGNDYIKNTSDNAVIFGGDHGDIIENYGNNALIQGDNDKGAAKSTIGDYIITDKSNRVTIDGGANADTITALHDVRASIVGGAGNDEIKLQRLSAEDLNKVSAGALVATVGKKALSDLIPVPLSKNPLDWLLSLGIFVAGKTPAGYALKSVEFFKNIYDGIKDFNTFAYYLADTSESTVAGGTGNDVIVSDGVAPRVFEYNAGDGNDTYHHFNDNKLGVDDFKLSTLDIKSGRISKIGVIGNDVTFVVAGEGKSNGSIKLVDGANKQFKLVEEAEGGNVFPRAYGINYDTNQVICSLFGSAADDVIQDNVGMERDKGTYIGDTPTDNDKIIHETNSLVIYGYGGDDNLRGNDKNDTIYGGAGADKLSGKGGNDVLDGGSGADEIYGNDGKDTIHGGDDDTIHGGAGNDYIENDGSNVQLYGDDDKDKIFNWWGYGVTIDGGEGNDTIEAHGEKITVEGGAGDDSIRLGGDINLISDNNSRNMTVNAGANDDTVKSGIPDCTITGGIGNDLISLSASADKNYIEYNTGDGNDRIYGLTNDDTLKIVSGEVDMVTVSGSDVIFKVGDGSLTFKKFAGKEFKVTHADGEVVKYKLSADKATKEVTGSIIGGKGQTTVYGTSKSNIYFGSHEDDLIYGNGGKDYLYGEGGNDTIYGGEGNDYIHDDSGENTIYGGAGNDMILALGKTNLIIYNWGDGDDTVSGSGTLRILGAGYASVASLGNMILEVGSFDNPVLQPENGRVTLVGGKKYFNVEGNYLGKLAVNGVSTDGKDVLVFEEFAGNAVDLTDFDDVTNLNASAASKGLKLNGNELDNTITGTAYNDTTMGGGGDNLFVMSGGKDVITDYQSGRDKIFVDTEPSVSVFKSGSVVIKSGSNSLTLKKLDDENIAVDGKTITFTNGTSETTKTYFTDKIIADENVTLNSAFKGTFDATNFKTVDASVVKVGLEIIGGSSSILGGKGNDLINGLSDNVFIDAGAGNDSIQNNGSGVSIVGGAGKDTIENYGANVSIDGGTNNDSIYNYGSDSTLSGGAGYDSLWGSYGADTFRYTSGKDVIFGFDDNDLLEIVGTFKPSYNASTNTIAFKVGSTTSAITLKDFTATTFNVNGESYQISGKTLIPK